MVGIQPATCKYPSPYCEWERNTPTERCKLRTFQAIIQNHTAWLNSRKSRKHLMDYMNCEAMPCSTLPSKGFVIDKFGVPILHVMLGIVNKSIDEYEVKVPSVSFMECLCIRLR